MNTLILRSFLAAAILAPIIAPAELIIYKGTEKETVTGQNNGLRINSKVIVIINLDTGNYAPIGYAILNGNKRLSTTQQTNAHIVQVSGTQSKIITVISRIPNDCDAQERPGKEAVVLKGANAMLTVSSNSTVSFPKTLNNNGSGLSHSSSSGELVLTDGIVLLTFNKAETLASNNAGESFDIAYARLLASVEAHGYTR